MKYSDINTRHSSSLEKEKGRQSCRECEPIASCSEHRVNRPRAELQHTKTKTIGQPIYGFVEPVNRGRTISVSRPIAVRLRRDRATIALVWYNFCMTKLLEQAIATVRDIPEDMQDMAAAALMRFLNELSTLDDKLS